MESRPRVLIVDNHEETTEALSILLSMDGCDVEVAATGAMGIARAAIAHPDVIILDLGLPDIPGEEVAATLRAVRSSTYVVAYSGYHRRRDAALAAGCHRFILKPDIDEILWIVRKARKEAFG